APEVKAAFCCKCHSVLLGAGASVKIHREGKGAAECMVRSVTCTHCSHTHRHRHMTEKGEGEGKGNAGCVTDGVKGVEVEEREAPQT
ncbi:hypothetical protein KIPB_010707, partial [Kipferlia bialata]